MGKSLKFVKLESSLKGLVAKGITEWNRYLKDDVNPQDFHWVCIQDPETLARTLEVVAVDLPEEDLAGLVTHLPYLLIVFKKGKAPNHVPVESTMAFLAILNRAGLVTILRQSTASEQLAGYFNLDAHKWSPLFFIVGGKLDLDHANENVGLDNLAVY